VTCDSWKDGLEQNEFQSFGLCRAEIEDATLKGGATQTGATNSSARGEFAEGGEEAVDFLGGVVVDEADAEHAAGGIEAEALDEV